MDDAQQVLFLRSDKEVNKYIQRPVTNTIADAEAFVDKITRGLEKGENINWSLTLKGDPKMIGSICLWNFSEDQKTGEVGYDLISEYHAQGIMSEALACVLDFGFDKLGLNEIEAFTHYLNEPSTRLLAKHDFKHLEGRKDEDNKNNMIFSTKNPAAKTV